MADTLAVDGGRVLPLAADEEAKQKSRDQQRISQHAHDILAVPRDTEFLQSFLRVDLGESESDGDEGTGDGDRRRGVEGGRAGGGWMRVLQRKEGLFQGGDGGGRSVSGLGLQRQPPHHEGRPPSHHKGTGRRSQHRESGDGMIVGKKTTFSQLKHDLRERHGAEGVASPVPPGAGADGGDGGAEQGRRGGGRRRRARQRSREEVYTDKDRAAAVNLGSKDIKQSLKMKRKQDRSKALQIPEEADPGAMLALGRRQMKAGRVSVALEFVNKALELQPEDVEALVSRSRCYLAVGQPGNALKDAEAALAVDPGSIRGIYQKAEALYHLGDFEHSLVFYHRGQRIRPEMECFRLGVQKAQEAIQNTIGKKGPQPKRGISKAKTTSSSPKGQSFPIGSHHRRNVPSSLGTSESGNRSSRQLLGELCIDKLYLENLLQHPDIKAPHQEGCSHIVGPAQEAVAYLTGREEFWRQQKVNSDQPSSARPTRNNRLKAANGLAR